MKKSLVGILFYFFTVTILLLTVPGCSKKAVEEVQATYLQQQFESNILNKNFRVHLATDTGADLTSQYAGYTFVLYKSSYYDGLMTAVKNGITYNGTWSCNDDYSKLSINFPSAPAEFVFLNRAWRFTKKSLPIMELAPWGTTDPKVLHMEQF